VPPEEQLPAQVVGDRCGYCNLRGIDAVAAEQTVASLGVLQIWRHSDCAHVLMWRQSTTPRELQSHLMVKGPAIIR
jgi:hypothetical protein